jgi:hypothetical protein
MSAPIQIGLALLSWMLGGLTALARLRYEDRKLARDRRRGVALMPIWPLLPMLILAPAIFVGFNHIVMKVIVGFHAVLLVWATVHISYWEVRRMRDV